MTPARHRNTTKTQRITEIALEEIPWKLKGCKERTKHATKQTYNLTNNSADTAIFHLIDIDATMSNIQKHVKFNEETLSFEVVQDTT